jgi:anti-sigma B factor antagonist
MRELEIQTENVGDVALVVAKGFLDSHTFEQMEDTINALFEEGVFKIAVDVGGVEYISSAGAGVFIGALSCANDNGGNVVLLNPTPNVQEVFDLLGLSQLFTIVNDKEKALEALGATAGSSGAT